MVAKGDFFVELGASSLFSLPFVMQAEENHVEMLLIPTSNLHDLA